MQAFVAGQTASSRRLSRMSWSSAAAVQNDWGTGFVANMTLANNASTDVVGWTLEFDFDRQTTNLWNAEIVSHVGNHYVLRAASWNQRIAANGGSISFGFQGATGQVSAGGRTLS